MPYVSGPLNDLSFKETDYLILFLIKHHKAGHAEVTFPFFRPEIWALEGIR